MKKTNKNLWIVVVAIFTIILTSYLYPKFKNSLDIAEDANNSNKANTSEKLDLKKKINHTDGDKAPDNIGYIEEKDGKIYEGILELKTYEQTQPGQVLLLYEGEVSIVEDNNNVLGVSWVECSVYQRVENLNNPPLEKEVIVKFNDRIFKGILEIEAEKGISSDGASVSYFGKLYYDDTLGEEDITEE